MAKGVDTRHLHWVRTPGAKPVAGTTAELYLNGADVGTMTATGSQGALQLTISRTPRFTFEMLEDSTAYAVITAVSVGASAVLTISDGCLCKYGS